MIAEIAHLLMILAMSLSIGFALTLSIHQFYICKE